MLGTPERAGGKAEAKVLSLYVTGQDSIHEHSEKIPEPGVSPDHC